MPRNFTLFIFCLVVLQTLAGISIFGYNEGTGLSRNGPIVTPTVIPTNNTSIKQVAGFGNAAYYLTESGDVFSVGENMYGQLGLGYTAFTSQKIFVKIPTLSNITYIAPGYNTAMVLNAKGKLFGFGRGDFGNLGTGATTQFNPTPIEVTTLSNILSIKLGGHDATAWSFVIAKNGDASAQLFVFGYNGEYQLGLGDTNNRLLPAVLNIPNIASIFPGRTGCFAITSFGEVYGWGENPSGQLGLGDVLNRMVPTLVNLTGIVEIGAAYSHTLFLNSTGSIYVTGFGGRLGFDDNVHRKVAIYNPNLPEDIVSVSTGIASNIIKDSKGRIYGFGFNGNGNLGINNTVVDIYLPKYIRNNVLAMSTGREFTLLLTKCDPGLDGDYCDIISCNGTLASDPSVCSRNGTCDGPNKCTCQSGWGGETCSVIACGGKLSTDPTVCSGNGQCSVPNTCVCQSGWTGNQCETPICAGKLATDPTVCSGKGQCKGPDNCACSAGWGGEQCEIPTCGGKLPTDPLVCGSRNGTCDAPNTCSCKTGFLGGNCDDWKCGAFGKSDVAVCSGKGICYLPNLCGCVAGSTGDNCEKATSNSSGTKLLGSIGLFVILLLNYLLV